MSTGLMLVLLTNLWWHHMQAGAQAERAGAYADAIHQYEAALSVPKVDSRQTVLAASALANAYAEEGQYTRAQRAYAAALAATEPESADRGIVLGSLASLEMEAGHRARGEALLRQSIEILEATEDSAELARARNNLAESLIAHRKVDEAQGLLMAAVESSTPELRAVALNNLGLAAFARNRHTEAIHYFRQSLDIFGDTPHAARVWNNLGSAYAKSSQNAEASDAYRRGLELAPVDAPIRAQLLRNYAAHARKTHQRNAADLAREADALTADQSLRTGRHNTLDAASFLKRGQPE